MKGFATARAGAGRLIRVDRSSLALLACALAAIFIASASSPASGATAATCASGVFKADYFSNATLSGSPVLSRCESTINYNWGEAKFDPAVPADNFSARWTGD